MACTPRSPRMQSEMDRLVFTPRARKASGSPPLKGMSLAFCEHAESNVNNQHATCSILILYKAQTSAHRGKCRMQRCRTAKTWFGMLKRRRWRRPDTSATGVSCPISAFIAGRLFPLRTTPAPNLECRFCGCVQTEAPGFLTPRTRTPSRIAARKAMQQLLRGGEPISLRRVQECRARDECDSTERTQAAHSRGLRDMRPVPSPRGFGGAVTLRAAPIVNQHGRMAWHRRPTWWPSD